MKRENKIKSTVNDLDKIGKQESVITWVQELEQKTTLVLSNTRELNRVLKYKTSTLYTNY